MKKQRSSASSSYMHMCVCVCICVQLGGTDANEHAKSRLHVHVCFLGYTYSRYQVACPMSAKQKMKLHNIRYLSQVTYAFPQTRRVGNPQTPARPSADSCAVRIRRAAGIRGHTADYRG